jgi:hypothetical protein
VVFFNCGHYRHLDRQCRAAQLLGNTQKTGTSTADKLSAVENIIYHMTPLELIFTAIGEEITRSETVKENVQSFIENREIATKSGQLAGEARELIEKRRGEKVLSADNFLNLGSDKDKPDALPDEKMD